MGPNRSLDRRSFLATAAAAGGGLALHLAPGPDAGATEAPGQLPIIDTHQHLWDLTRFSLPWLGKDGPLSRSFVSADYQKAVEGLNVVGAVYMEVDVALRQKRAEAEYVVDICARGDTPMKAAVIGGRPGTDGFAGYVTAFKGSTYVKGVRKVLHNSGDKPSTCLDPDFVKSIRLLGDLGLSFDLCMRHEELADAAKLVDLCPDTRFILDHCGNPPVGDNDRTRWKRDIETMASKRRVVCKVSGIVASAEPGKWSPDDLAPIVNHVLDSFGPDRVMFGGDWPVCTRAASFRQWVEALKQIVSSRPRAAQKKLFHDNAKAFYGLT